MKIKSDIIAVFVLASIIYFAVSTKFTFHPAWTVDYFNQLAQSIIHGRLDISNPSMVYDLVFYNGKWYAPWGILSALFLIPAQLIKGRFVPSLYLGILFGSLNVVLLYSILQRVRREFYPWMRKFWVYAVTALFAFGTTNFYLATLGSVWHVDQMVSSFFGNLGIWFIFTKKRTIRDYVLSAWCISLTLLGRATLSLLILFPALLFLYDHYVFLKPKERNFLRFTVQGLGVFGLPFILFSLMFFGYNFVRFGNIFEYGYRYIHESPYLAQIRLENGIMSLKNLPTNVWYMLFEIPKFSLNPMVHMDINLKGNSIFFLTPPFLAILWANPFFGRGRKISELLMVRLLWMTSVIVMIPSLLLYSTGWMQFGYRYSLDITLLLTVLSVFGMKGKLNMPYYAGILFAIVMYSWGIHILQ